jgi:hypothetical protein
MLMLIRSRWQARLCDAKCDFWSVRMCLFNQLGAHGRQLTLEARLDTFITEY